MASHIWQVTKFRPRTVALGAKLFTLARASGMSYPESYTWVGYAAETARQGEWGVNTGWDGAYGTLDNKPRNTSPRYTKGRNAPLYHATGRRLVVQALRDALECDHVLCPSSADTLLRLAEAGGLDSAGVETALHDTLTEVGAYLAVATLNHAGLPGHKQYLLLCPGLTDRSLAPAHADISPSMGRASKTGGAHAYYFGHVYPELPGAWANLALPVRLPERLTVPEAVNTAHTLATNHNMRIVKMEGRYGLTFDQ